MLEQEMPRRNERHDFGTAHFETIEDRPRPAAVYLFGHVVITIPLPSEGSALSE